MRTGARLAIFGVTSSVIAVFGCRSLLDLDVDYASCVPSEETLYRNSFQGELSDLIDRCWVIDPGLSFDGGPNSQIDVVDGDLLILPNDVQRWTDGGPGPLVYREVAGDFVLAARVETVEATSAGHCVGNLDLSGLVVRLSADRAVWGAVFLGPVPNDEPRCVESDLDPPAAGAEVWSHALRIDAGVTRYGRKSPIGEDGEADVAICRAGNRLFYYYYDRNAPSDGSGNTLLWRKLEPRAGHLVGAEPVEAGFLSTGAGAGHFDAMVLQRGTFLNDGCTAPLEQLAIPESE